VTVTINTLRSSHPSLEQRLAKQGIVLSAVCDCEKGTETAERIFWECPRLTKERAKLSNLLKKWQKINFHSLAEMLKTQNLGGSQGTLNS
jgi:hypothetical protein